MYINLLVNAHSDQNITEVCHVNMTYTLTADVNMTWI